MLINMGTKIYSQALFGLDHGFDTIVHILDEFNLVSSESSQVGDIEDTIVSLGVLSVDTSDLYVIFVSDRLMEIWVLHELWKVDVNGSSKSGTKVSWAGRNVTEMLIVGEFGFLLNEASSGGESLEDGTDIGSLLHGDDSKLIFFVNPDEESLSIIMEDSSTLWPVSLETAGFKIFISTLEEEMIGNELGFLSRGHLRKGVVFTFKFSSEFTEGGGDEFFNLDSVNS